MPYDSVRQPMTVMGKRHPILCGETETVAGARIGALRGILERVRALARRRAAPAVRQGAAEGVAALLFMVSTVRARGGACRGRLRACGWVRGTRGDGCLRDGCAIRLALDAARRWTRYWTVVRV